MRYVIEVSYLGTDFHGWQRQNNASSIQEELEKVLSLVLGQEISINGSSRTDTGVHARQQFAHFESINYIKNIKKIPQRLNKLLPKSIAVINLYIVPNGAHTRFDAINRSYKYRLNFQKDPFNFQYTAIYPDKYDVAKMNLAANLLFEYKDFQCFSKVKTDVKTYNCDIEEAKWERSETGLVFTIKSNRFLRGMVRAIVGTLLDIGTGKISIENFKEIINSKDRNLAGNAAKAEGLTLETVTYPDGYFDPKVEITEAKSSEMDIVRALFLEYSIGLGISLCFQNFENELETLPGIYSNPKGGILLAKLNDEIAGIVALKPLTDYECEMKRLYVKPAFQGFGIGKLLVESIQKLAKNKQYTKIKLDTLARLKPAVNMYKNLEYLETKPYNYNPEEDILYFEKEL